MTAVAELDLPAFDYSDPELTGKPWHDAVRAARERGWLARAEPIGFFVLEREAAAFFLRTPKATFPGTTILELQGVTEGPLWERLRGNLLDLDGDDHRRLRKLVQPAFTPPAADRHREAMRRHLVDLFEPIAGGGAFEATAALTKPYPARMIAELMGAPQADADRLGVWANLIQGQFDPIKVANERESLERAAAEFVDYTRALLADRHDDPRRRPDLPADRRRGGGRPPERRRGGPPDQRDPGRRRRHNAGAARPRADPLRPPPRPVGAPRRAARARAAGRRGAPALRADHPDHGADHARGDRVRRRHLPRGHAAVRRRRRRQPRSRRLRGARALRHHRRARPREAAHLRGRPPLLPRRQPRPRRAAGGAHLSRPADARPRARGRPGLRHAARASTR